MSRPAWLAAHPSAAWFEGLLAVVWADGAIAPEEYAALDELIVVAGFDATAEERAAWYHTPPDPDVVAAEVTDPLDRRFLLDRALLLARADGEAAEGERALIARWAAAWEIDAAELAALEAGWDGGEFGEG